MFSTGLSLLTATSMLIHSIVGCCWHSGHDHTGDHTAACEAVAAVEAAEHAHDHDTCSGHQHEPQSDSHSDDDRHQHDDGPCHPDECSDHACVSMLTPTVSVDLLIASAMLWTSSLSVIDIVETDQSQRLARGWQFGDHQVSDAQHRCALSQTWLL